MGSFPPDLFRPVVPSTDDATSPATEPRQSRIALEPRMLFDGSVAATADSPIDEPQAETDLPVSVDAAAAQSTAPSALLVIDPSVDDWQTLVGDLDPNTTVLVLDPNENGVSQIANAMLEHDTISELHIVSHGTAGQISIGNESLHSSNLAQYSEDLAVIGSQLTESGDILLYGCNVGDGSAGAQFLAAVARATSADIAASVDLTGSASLGGDWDLEVVTGDIEADIAISTQAQNTFTGLLMPVSTASLVDSSEAGTSGSIVAPGEVVRLRMVVDIPDGATTGAELRPDLPPGLRFANDGSTTIALVSDSGFTTTVPGPGVQVAGGGATAADVAGITPTQQLDASMITDGAGGALPAGVMASGADPVFELGDLTNLDGADADSEFIIIEFNAIVENEAINNFAAGPSPFNFEFHGNGALEDTSNTHDMFVSEPAIFDVSKVVTSVVGNQITYQVTFSNTGGQDAHNVRIYEDFVGAVNQTFNGPTGVTGPGTLINNSDADTLDLEIPVVSAGGGSVTITYTATAPNTLLDVPVTDVDVTYTSLSAAGESLDVSVEDGTGTPTVVTTNTTGERTGDVGDYGGAVNTYLDSESAGLGYIAGQLWEDVDQSNTIDAGETLLSGITVDMVWAGADGIFGNADDQSYTTTTDINGRYEFGLLPGGDYRMTTALTINDPSIGLVQNTFDRSATGPQGDGITEHSLFEGEVCNDHDFGYTRQNEAPAITLPAAPVTVDEETKLTLSGADAIVISDPDSTETGAPSPFPSTYEVVLAVTNGTLEATAAGTAGVTGSGTNSLTITGSLADVNATLDGLCYTGDTNFCGDDTVSITVNDGGTYGEVDNDGTPSEPVDDNLVATSSFDITVNDTPDAPTANADAQTTNESTAVSGNALTGTTGGDVADTDPDCPPETLSVCGVIAGTGTAPTDTTGVGVPIAGTYGSIEVDATGAYTYTPGAAAMALNTGDVVQDVFTYAVCDATGNTVETTITITINGADGPNAPPEGTDNTFTISEDLINEGGTPLTFSAADFGFTDPDTGDTFQSVCIDTIPPAASGTLALNGVAVTAGDEILVADIPNLTFTPAPDVNNTTLGAAPTFTFSVRDSQGDKDTIPNTITINITPEPVNSPPDGVDSVFTISEDLISEGGTPLSFTAADFGFTDPDAGDTFDSVCIVTVPASGTLALNGTTITAGQQISVADIPNITFTPAPDTNNVNLGAAPNFTFAVVDSQGNKDPNPNTVTINITPEPPVANTPPDAVDTTFTISEDLIAEGGTPLMFSASDFGFTDADPGDSFTSVCIVTVPASGTLTLNGATVTAGQQILVADIANLAYTPAPDANNDNLGAAPNFTFAVVDSQGNKDPVPNTITINITPEHTEVEPLPTPPPSVIDPDPRSGLLPNRETRDPTPYTPVPDYFYEPGDEIFERIIAEPVEMSMFSPIAAARPWQTIGDLQERKQQAIVKAASEAHVDDDCEPMKPVKAKPSVVKRSILGDSPKEKPASFSDQIKKQKPKVKPRKPARIC